MDKIFSNKDIKSKLECCICEKRKITNSRGAAYLCDEIEKCIEDIREADDHEYIYEKFLELASMSLIMSEYILNNPPQRNEDSA